MKNGKKAFLATPGYGRQTNAAGRAIWRASADMDSVWVAGENSSLLAANFNCLWCEALNIVHRGKRVDYFAMIHDDISAPDGWLDELIDEMEAHDLDMLGVVVPIKDTRGLSSCALHKEGDNWQVAARLTMREVFRLPETFTSNDLGHKLLLNTGMWVCRFGEWAKQVHFEINDRIVFDKRRNMYRPQNESEDWYFSRLCHELDLKIGATRKIKVAHRGELDFTNDVPWGSCEFDDTATDKSLLPLTDKDGFRWPYDVIGWLRHEEGKELWRLAKDKRVLEVGSYCGCSTICLAQTAKSVLSVDPHDGSGTPAPMNTFEQFQKNVERYGVAEWVTTHIGTLADELPANEFDLIFIDGKHDTESVREDIRLALPRLAPGGLLAFHDYQASEHPGIEVAVDELVSAGGDLVKKVKSLAVVRPPAQIAVEN